MKVNGNVGLQQSMRRMLSGAQKMQAMQIRRIASGYRINSAGDDASGLAIGKRINAQLTGLSTASMNAQDAISYIQTAEGAMDQVHSITNRMTELATRASNGLLSSTERNMIQAEYKQLSSEIDRIGQSTDFNGLKPFDGSSQQMQVGATAGEQITVEAGKLSAASLGLDKVDLSSLSGAQSALDRISSATDRVSSQRANLGATENSLASTINALDNTNENLQAGLSRIMDADIAKESTNRSISMALNATSIAMMKNAQQMMAYNAVSMLMR